MSRSFLCGFAALAFAASISAPARAEPPAPLTPEALLGGLVQENDVSLMFSYVRDAFRAALRGQDAQPPYELQRRADEIGYELKRRGAIAGDMLINEIERSMRDELRQRPAIPSSDYRQRI
jgi:hypothetical protein